jgi:hypothetical protein
MINQKGEDEIRTATIELGSHFSAQITAPVPPSNNINPVMIAGFIFFQGPGRSPLSKHHPINNIPAAKKRKAPKIIGGKYFIATCIKK